MERTVAETRDIGPDRHSECPGDGAQPGHHEQADLAPRTFIHPRSEQGETDCIAADETGQEDRQDGVEAFAWTAEVAPDRIGLARRLPILL